MSTHYPLQAFFFRHSGLGIQGGGILNDALRRMFGARVFGISFIIYLTQPAVESNWNLGRFLPEAGACQTNFKMIVAGYIMSVYQCLMEEQRHHTPGNTPVRRRGNTQSQSQVGGG